jgi:hypothetical protein
MPPIGLLFYNLKNRWLLAASILEAATMSIFYFGAYKSTTNLPPDLIFFYTATYILTALVLRNMGAGMLITAATTGFWEIPAQFYVYFCGWRLVEFSGWTWCIYCTAIVYALLWVAKIPLRKAVPFILASTLVNAVLIPQKAMWYFCRVLMASTLAYLVWKYGEKSRRSWFPSKS